MTKIIALFFALFLSPFLYDCYLVEVVVVVVVWRLIVKHEVVPMGWLASAGACWGRIARERGIAYALAFAVPIVARLMLLPVYPRLAPFVPDEFSHLLLAETLAKGRLTNPTHPLWVFFESIHIFHTPTYNSMYLPGHATLLALGIRIGNDPWWGVLLEAGLLSVGLLWALRGFFSANWSLFGTMLFALRAGVLSYWTNSFWGGSLAAAGGALVLGACVRLPRRPSVVQGVALGAGLSILGCTRPYEGLSFSLACLLPTVWKVVHGNQRPVCFLKRAVIPATILVILTVGMLLSYFQAVTGNALESPYGVNRQTYGWPTTLAWLKPVKVEYRHKELQDYYNFEMEEHAEIVTPGGFFRSLGFRMQKPWVFFVGPALSLAFAFLPWVWKDRRIRLAATASVAVLVVVLAEQSGYAHYHSPATAAYWVVLVQCLRHLRVRKWRRIGEGERAMAAVTLSLLLMWPVRISAPWLQRNPGDGRMQTWCCNSDYGRQRAEVAKQLSRIGGQHLAVVRYKHERYDTLEWVYNSPDIDSSQIVWARDMGWDRNRQLVEYYRQRNVWLVEPEARPVRVRRYEEAERQEYGESSK